MICESPENPTRTHQTVDNFDVVDAAQILCSTSKPKGKETFNPNNKLRTVHLDNGIDVPSVPGLYYVKALKQEYQSWKDMRNIFG
jgi:hypothetical protein